MPWLISPLQLEKFCKTQKNVLIFDASWHLSAERNAYEEFKTAHIAGAKFLDLNLFHEHISSPNMLIKDVKTIEEKVNTLGISNDHKLVFYDQSDLHSSCRALWMFKYFGHNPNQLYILNGGLKAWHNQIAKIETGEGKISQSKTYQVNIKSEFDKTRAQIKANLREKTAQIIDLRHPVRFAGGKEVRPNLRHGHIPGSFCFPYFIMFEEDRTFKPLEKIRKRLYGIGVEFSNPIVTTCGSGITSAILNFVLDLMEYEHHALYDGSWAEWGANTLYPEEHDLSERPVCTSLA